MHNYMYPRIDRHLSDSRESRPYSLISNVIAEIVSQNCGRQPHIVSTNHSNLIAVGPIRSLASRQAIVWTYRPRVEESQSPDFALILN